MSVEIIHERLAYPDREITIGELERTIQDLVQEFCHVYIAIDALDECEQIEELLEWIQGLFSKRVGVLHLLISSRQIQNFRETLEPIASATLNISQSTFEQDI